MHVTLFPFIQFFPCFVGFILSLLSDLFGNYDSQIKINERIITINIILQNRFGRWYDCFCCEKGVGLSCFDSLYKDLEQGD